MIKAPGPHDGRHDLTARGGDRFDRRGKSGAKSQTLHHRNGESPGRDDVGRGASGDGPEQGTGDRSDFGGPTLQSSRQAHRDFHEIPVPPPVNPMKAPTRTKMAMMLAEMPVSCPQIPPVVR